MAELAALRRVLSASRGTFSLSVAVCNSPALRDHIIARLQGEAPTIEVLALPAPIGDVYGHVSAHAHASDRAALFLVDLERSVASDDAEQAVLRGFNASRELWRSGFSCPVVLWLPEYAATLLSIHARDFWAWCSHRFEFVSERAIAGAAAGHSAGSLDAAANLDVDRKHFRIAELQQRLREAGDPPPPELAQHAAAWLAELGVLRQVRGDLDQAERMHRKSLEINEQLGRREGMASQYGNLGLIHQTRGDLDEAERMHRKALEIDEQLGRREGMATHYGNLGLIHQTRGELDEAERMHRKALAIDEQLGQLEGMASGYAAIALVHQARGELDEAERMHRKALEIEEQLGRQEGMARQYGNLGLIHKTRGQLDEAERMQRKALAIDERLGRLEGMATHYGNLGLIHRTRGELDEAERMHRKALAIDEQLGRLEGMATHYANLGSLQRQRGDMAGARELWTKARDLYARIGMPQMVAQVQGWIDALPDEPAS